MADKIPQEQIDDIRRQVNIIDVIGAYTELTKRGRQYNGSCPFHEDQHPSLFVDDVKQVYHCFSCGQAGSVFNFVMAKTGITFPEAVRQLAEQTSVQLPERMQTSSVAHHARRFPYQDLYNDATRLYHHMLVNTTAGEAALAYLTEKRQLSLEAIAHFQIGFAPPEQVLLGYAQKQGLAAGEYAGSQLFLQNDQGEWRDRFAGRIVWPINDSAGNTVGFSGRALADSNRIKYMNSPESDFFQKSELLYHLDDAQQAIRQKKSVTIFEGFMDVISADLAGQHTGVATMGTALTAEHLRALGRLHVDQIVLAYDGDAAGQKATARSIQLIAAKLPAVQVVVATLPDGCDPDECRLQYGVDYLAERLSGGYLTPIEFQLKQIRQNRQTANQSDLMAVIQESLVVLARATPLEQDIHLTKLAQEFDIQRETLRQQLHAQPASPTEHPALTADVPPELPEVMAAPTEQAKRVTRIELAERALLVAMLLSPTVQAQVERCPGFAFVHKDYQLLMMLLVCYRQQAPGPVDLAAFMDFVGKPHLNATLMASYQAYAEMTVHAEAIHDYLHIITKEAPILTKIATVQQALEQAKAQHDQLKMVQLTRELITLKQEQNQITHE